MPYYRRGRYRKYRPRIRRRRFYRRRRFVRRKWNKRRRPYWSRLRARVVSMWIKYDAIGYQMPTYGAGATPILTFKNTYFRINGSTVTTTNQPTAALLEYDQYRIAKVVTRWCWPGAPQTVRENVPTWAIGIGTADTGGAWPILHTQVDKDGLFPGTIQAMRDHNGYKCWEMRPGKKYSRSYVPAVNSSINATATSWRQIKNPWLSTQYPQVNHYGMVWTVDNTLGNVDWSPTRIWVEHWCKYQFRYPKGRKIYRAMERQLN